MNTQGIMNNGVYKNMFFLIFLGYADMNMNKVFVRKFKLGYEQFHGYCFCRKKEESIS